MSFFKGLWAGIIQVWLHFWTNVWKFIFDMVTDKQGNYDEKRVMGLGFIILGVLIGLKVVGAVDMSFAYFLISTGIGLYFGAGVMDGITPQTKAGNVDLSKVLKPGANDAGGK
jgi:hypothetical protein